MSKKFISLRKTYLECKASMADKKGDHKDDAVISFYDQALFATEGRIAAEGKLKERDNQLAQCRAEVEELNKTIGKLNSRAEVAESRLVVKEAGKIEWRTGTASLSDET